jgi:hypothetical protein
MVAQDDAKIVPTVEAPTDTITDIMGNLIDHAIATGAQPIDTAAARADEIKDNQEGTPEMAKEAELIEKIAQAVIEKLAGVEDLAPAANQIQADTAQMVAQQDAIIQPTPGGEGTLNQILDAIVADAKAKGAISYDTAATGESAAAAEEQDEQVEKAAAVSALVEAGVGFEDAVDMVKQAEVEIWAEEEGLAKQAALDELMIEGLDFDAALDLIKEASDAGFFSVGIEKEAATLEGEYIPAGGGMVAKIAQPEAAAGPSMMGKLKGVLGTRAGKIGGAVAALGAAAALGRASKSQTKQAALDELMAEGVSFEDAVDLIKEASDKVSTGESTGAAGRMLSRGTLEGLGGSMLGAATRSRALANAGGLIGSAHGMYASAKNTLKKRNPNVSRDDAALAAGKAYGRGYLESAGGALAGAGAGAGVAHMLGKRMELAGGVGAAIGGIGGLVHGAQASLKKSMNKHQEKKAAFDYLIEAGVDFEEAANLVKEASVQVYGE